jgi:hypothetical protein
MTRTAFAASSACALIAAVAASTPLAGQEARQKPSPEWQQVFAVSPADLSSVGENPYLVLQPGYQLVLEGKESGKAVRLVVSVLDETKAIGGIDARVVEERETESGVLVEVSRNYLAIHKTTHDVYYLGEDVDEYKGGKISGHGGAWLHGAGGAKLGLLIPAAPVVGQRYYQEVAPSVAMDRAEVVSVTERVTTPAGTFEKCLKTAETTPLESGREFKLYAPGVGLITDGSLVLVSYTKR